ncbi:hypothetical protein PTSG_09928 [Salpingoeca rosetta]|uniref:PH domain-containing protein n=1 Tax=Salpingoeca rosetta (strain ATCC 50818 / BSB-021) TaxID=946362 RepID=F2UNJ5_SALR5|nr:uncharacterized protein PTSG_09928 [Salpingoeca rosetta]EGD79200.1 hypothetical protein PTSG_09928 [Salpingoeca rosetta]|eukprot:XP_004989285.1 hypothetical protein PTSG_09928 [Salpingoeca rosetta]
MSSLASIQTALRNRDGSEIQEFQLDADGRQLVAADTFTMAESVRSAKGIGSRRKTVIEAFVVLCNDVLVITQQQQTAGGDTVYLLLADPLDLDQCTVTSVFYDDDREFLVEENTKQSSEASSQRESFSFNAPASPPSVVVANSFVFRCRTAEMKKQWLQKVHNCICRAKGLPIETPESPPAQQDLVKFRHNNSFTRKRSRKEINVKLEEPHERRLQSRGSRRSQDEVECPALLYPMHVWVTICKTPESPPAQQDLVKFRHNNSFTRKRSRKEINVKLEEPHERRLQSRGSRRSQDEASDHTASSNSIAVSRGDSSHSVAAHLVEDAQRVAERRPIMRKFVDRLRRRTRHIDEPPAELRSQRSVQISEGTSKRLIEKWESRHGRRRPSSERPSRRGSKANAKASKAPAFRYEQFYEHRQFFEDQATGMSPTKDTPTSRQKRFDFDIPTTRQNVHSLVEQLGGGSSEELKTLTEDTVSGSAQPSVTNTYTMSWDYGDDFPAVSSKTDEMVVGQDTTSYPASRSPRQPPPKSPKKSPKFMKRLSKSSTPTKAKRDSDGSASTKKKGMLHRMRESLRIRRRGSRKSKDIAPLPPTADDEDDRGAAAAGADLTEDTSAYAGYHPLKPRTALSRRDLTAGVGSLAIAEDEFDTESIDLDIIRRDLHTYEQSTLAITEEDRDLEQLQASTLALKRQMEEEEEEYNMRRLAAEKKMEDKQNLMKPLDQSQAHASQLKLPSHLLQSEHLPTLGSFISANWQQLMYPTETGDDLIHSAQNLSSNNSNNNTGLLDVLRSRQKTEPAHKRQVHLRQKWTGNLSRDVYGVNQLRREFQTQHSTHAAVVGGLPRAGGGALSPTMQQLIMEHLHSDEGVASEHLSQQTHTQDQDDSGEHVYETIADMWPEAKQRPQQPRQPYAGRRMSVVENMSSSDDSTSGTSEASKRSSATSSASSSSTLRPENGYEHEDASVAPSSPTISPEVHAMYHGNLWTTLPQDPVPISVQWSLAKNSQLAGLTAVQLRLLAVFAGALGQCSETSNL